jgi:hypothetical protein
VIILGYEAFIAIVYKGEVSLYTNKKGKSPSGLIL